MVYDTYGEYAAGSNVVVIGTFPQQYLVTVTFELFAMFLRDNFLSLRIYGQFGMPKCVTRPVSFLVKLFTVQLGMKSSLEVTTGWCCPNMASLALPSTAINSQLYWVTMSNTGCVTQPL